MHWSCLRYPWSFYYSCAEFNSSVFECECKFLNITTGNVTSNFTFYDFSYFSKWFDEEACVAKKITGKYYGNDSPNLSQLSDYCDKWFPLNFLVCIGYSLKDPQDAFCGCGDETGKIYHPEFKFDKRLVWTDANKKVMAKSTLASQIIHIPETTTSTTHVIDTIGSTFPTSTTTQNTHITTSFNQSDAQSSFDLYSGTRVRLSHYLYPIFLLLILIALVFVCRKFFESIRSFIEQRFRHSAASRPQDISEL